MMHWPSFALGAALTLLGIWAGLFIGFTALS